MTTTPAPFSPVTSEEFTAAMPEFVGVPIQFDLNLQNKKQNKAAWGEYWREAVILATAHEAALKYDISAGLAATGKKNPLDVDFVTLSSASPSSMSESRSRPTWATGDDVLDSNYGRSDYGRQYLTLLIEVVPPGRVVNSSPVVPRQPGGPGYRSRTS